MPADRDPDSGASPAQADAAADTVRCAPVLDTAIIEGPPADADSGGATIHTVGDELHTATVERFGEVDDDRFEILDELACGGLGRVVRARDPRTGRVVALKHVLRPTADDVVRFAREAMVTANLQHPAIVPVYEVGRWQSGEPYYAMKLVEGRALDALFAEATTHTARIALLHHVIAVSEALAYAHGQRVIHRDLKPANVLVGPYGETVVIDWGLARHVTATDHGVSTPPSAPRPGDTVIGEVMGTPAYMPPEQAAGRPLDARADVYAIGAILYHLLAGVRPYADEATVQMVLAAVAAGPPRPLAQLAPGAAPELIAIVERAMAREPAARYSSARGLAEDLRRFQTGQLVGAHRYSTRQLLRRWLRRHQAVAATAAIAVLALAGFGAVSVRRIARERDRARAERTVALGERMVARAARELAEHRLGDSLDELGRQATLAQAPERALPFLAGAAAADGRTSPARALLLGQARTAFDGLVAVAPVDPGGTSSFDLAAGGTILLTTSADDVLRAWDLDGRRVRWTAAGVARIRAAPDGRTLVAAGSDGEVTVRAAADGAIVERWAAPAPLHERERPELAAWSPAGDRFAVATSDGRIFVGGPGAASLDEGLAHRGAVRSMSFAPDGRALATIAADGILAVRDPLTGLVRARLTEADAHAIRLVWRDAGELVSVDSDLQARLWRVADRAVVRRFPLEGYPYGAAISPDGTRMVTFGEGDSTTLWPLDRDEPGLRLAGHPVAVDHAAFAAERLITADEAGALRVWDPATGELARSLPAEGAIHGLVASGRRVVIAGEGRPRIWEPGDDRPMRRLHGHTARVRDLVFAARGAVLWSASSDGSARGVELATGTTHVLGTGGFVESAIADATRLAPNPRGLRSLTITADGARIYTAREDGTIGAWDPTTGAAVATWRGHTAGVRRIALADDGATAYTVGDTTLRRWDLVTGRETARVELGAGARDLALAAGGARIVTLTDDERVALWDAATLTALPTRPLPSDHLAGLVVAGDRIAIADDDHLVLLALDGAIAARTSRSATSAVDVGRVEGVAVIAAGDAIGGVTLHDRASLAPVRSWRTGDGAVHALRFRPDGAILATGGERRVQLWDPATGLALASSPDVPGPITQVAWSPDGLTLAFADAGGTIRVWSLPADDGRDLADLVACVSPLRLQHSALTAAPFDPARCAVLPTH